jgi:hypothetical protein
MEISEQNCYIRTNLNPTTNGNYNETQYQHGLVAVCTTDHREPLTMIHDLCNSLIRDS